MNRPIPDVELIAPDPVHAADWVRWRSQAPGRWFNPYKPMTVAAAVERLKNCSTDPTDPKATELRWMVRHDGRVVGTVAASSISREMGYAEISYLIDESAQGRGLATRAAALMLDRLFAPGGLRKAMAMIAVDNLGSIRVAEKVGFVREGLLREHYVIGDRIVDECVYGMLARQWRVSPGAGSRVSSDGSQRADGIAKVQEFA